jgi:hypothetical protein
MATKFGSLAKAVDQNRRVLDLYDGYLMGKRDARKEAEALTWILTKNLPADGQPGRDRTGYWSASSSGDCLRKQQFTYLGFPRQRNDADAQNIFENGDFLHLRYQVAGLLGGWLQDVEVPLASGDARGTADGILTWKEVLELKSINSRGFESVLEFGPKKLHKYQATAYMMMSGLSRTRFVYENKDRNTNAEFVFDLSEDYAAQVRAQWAEGNQLNTDQQLAERLHDCKQERGTTWRYCPYNKICAGAVFPKRKLVLE